MKNSNFKGYHDIWVEANDFFKPKNGAVMLKWGFLLDKQQKVHICKYKDFREK